jgi:glycerol-3-phosphate dehydrogenase (NAD(P)+)
VPAPRTVGIVGAGGWGTALACVLSHHGNRVLLWSHSPQTAEVISVQRENLAYLPGVVVPDAVEITTDLAALAESSVIVIATPTQRIRASISSVPPSLFRDAIVVNCSKGIEITTGGRISQVVQEVWGVDSQRYAVLSGPSHAEEVGHGLPTAVVAASDDTGVARMVQALFMTPFFRVYSSIDVVGVELAGALKNVIALSAGIVDGAGLGDNLKAALITRGLAEMSAIGEAMGANPKTFMGLSGLGDLIATCGSRHSRNRFVGEQIGRGRTLESVESEMKMIAEGVSTTRAAHALATNLSVEAPIIHEVYRILFEGKDTMTATRDLMQRAMKEE